MVPQEPPGRLSPSEPTPMLPFLQRLYTPNRRPQRAVRSRSVAPRVEELEPRLVLDTMQWNSAVAGTWDNKDNWKDNGVVGVRAPNFGDDVIFDGTIATGTCTVNAGTAKTLTLKNGA